MNDDIVATGDGAGGDGRYDSDRRDFLKKSAVAGALAWSAPAIASLPGGTAWAQTYEGCPCFADATGLVVKIPTDGSLVNGEFDSGAEDPCVASVDTGEQSTALGTIRVQATTVCADETTGENSCRATASIQTLDISGSALGAADPIHAEVLTSEATAQCDPCSTTGDSTVAALTVGGTSVVDLGLDCNTDVLALVGLSALGTLTFNRQFCDGDDLTVQALYLRIDGLIELIAAESRAGDAGCCTACA